MGREVRRVPADWQHPKDANRQYIPLFGGSYSARAATWDLHAAKWAEGLMESFSVPGEWVSNATYSADYLTYEDWNGARPVPEEYMPDWPDEQRTHWQFYENTSEGTPLSPVFATAEELADWLATNYETRRYEAAKDREEWLACVRQWSTGEER